MRWLDCTIYLCSGEASYRGSLSGPVSRSAKSLTSVLHAIAEATEKFLAHNVVPGCYEVAVYFEAVEHCGYPVLVPNRMTLADRVRMGLVTWEQESTSGAGWAAQNGGK